MKEHFEEVLGLGNASDNPSDLAAYSYDASELSGTARVVLFPTTDEHLRLILTFCNRTNLDVVIRGSGSNITGMAVPNNAAVLSTNNFNRIHTLNVQEGWVRVDCGVTIAQLNDSLSAHAVHYPLQGAMDALTTIGGLLATNGKGRYSGKYGLPSDTLLELEVMDGTGKLYTVSKDLEQYCGTEGSVFFLIRAKLKVEKKTERSCDVLFFDTAQDALTKIQDLRKDKTILAVDYFDVAAATYAGFNTRHMLFIEREGSAGSYTHENYARILVKRNRVRHLLGARGHTIINDGKVHDEQFIDAVTWCVKHDTPVICHGLTGVIHPFFTRQTERLRNEWTTYLTTIGASVAGQYGYGIRNKIHVPADLKAKIRTLKERYDYNNTLGKGRLYDYV